MNELVVLGTDTDAGKTTFCLLWLAAFADYDYWKPVETGSSDSQRLTELIPGSTVHPPLKRFTQPVAPPLAARRHHDVVPPAATIAAARPRPRAGRSLVIETFGSPFSPLNESELQVKLVTQLSATPVLVGSSSLGAIGRTLSCLEALANYSVVPQAVVLVGEPDIYAAEEIARFRNIRVFALTPPRTWDVQGLRRQAAEQQAVLQEVRTWVAADRNRPQRSIPWHTPANLIERDAQAVWHPYTSLRDPDAPLECVGAEDEFLFLADGRRIIDGISSWWTILHGHRHPLLLAALQQATKSFDHVHFAGVTHAPAVELAELLLQTAPWQGGRVFYSDNGSTAVEVALKMAYQYWCHRGQPHRTRFVGFEAGYHGDTFGAMAVSRDPVFFGRFEPLLFHADIIPLSPKNLHELLSRMKGKIAAVIIEPLVQGAGGMRMHTPEVLRQLVEIARSHDVLFIADEVMTCGDRTGSLWAHQQAGIAPDLICASKTLAGGLLPLAVTLAAPHLVETWQTADRSRTFFHGHSFTAHPLACAVALANWKILITAPRPAPARMETFWNTALQPLRRLTRVRDVRVRGTIAAVELDVPGGYLADAGRTMRRVCLEEGVLLRPLGSVLYAMPPMCTSQESLERIACAMIRATESVVG